MWKWARYLLPLPLLLLLLLLAACTGPTGLKGEKGDTGDTGDTGSQGSPPSAAEIEAAVREVLAPGATAASIAEGGRLYDKWWTEAGATAPTTNNALWGLQTTNTRSGGDTWRCKECHGWDYKGAGGAYSSGSHYTGFTEVYLGGSALSKDALVAVLNGASDYRHDFSSVLDEEEIEALADFLKYGLINDTQYIDYATKTPKNAVVSHGQTLFGQACQACHGADGKQIDFGGGEFVGTLANDNPWEFLHKVRSGQPGTTMPSAIVNGWSIQDVIDVLGYAQTLPTE